MSVRRQRKCRSLSEGTLQSLKHYDCDRSRRNCESRLGCGLSKERSHTIQSAVTSAAGSMIVRCLADKLLRICYHNISLLSLLTLWHVVPPSMWLSDQHFSESNVKTFNFEKTCTKTRRRGIKSRISWDPWTELNEKYKECQAFHDLWGLKNLQG